MTEDAKSAALNAIIRAEHDGNCGISNACAHLRSIREALYNEDGKSDIAKALDVVMRALNSIDYARKSMGDLYKAEFYIKSLK